MATLTNMENFTLTATFHLNPMELYDAWLDSTSHSEMTGSPAEIYPVAGSVYTAWEGYISGKILELEAGKRILQTFRTTEFAPEDEDSLLELLLEPVVEGARLTLHHTRIPEGQGEGYRKGWLDFYFEPMAEYFEIG